MNYRGKKKRSNIGRRNEKSEEAVRNRRKVWNWSSRKNQEKWEVNVKVRKEVTITIRWTRRQRIKKQLEENKFLKKKEDFFWNVQEETDRL